MSPLTDIRCNAMVIVFSFDRYPLVTIDKKEEKVGYSINLFSHITFRRGTTNIKNDLPHHVMLIPGDTFRQNEESIAQCIKF